MSLNHVYYNENMYLCVFFTFVVSYKPVFETKQLVFEKKTLNTPSPRHFKGVPGD